MPARNTTANLDELVSVTFTDTAGNRHKDVSLPRRLLLNGSQSAKQRWMIANGVIPDPDAPELPALVEEVKQDQAEQRLISQGEAVATLRKQLDELQSKLDGQPLSMAELVDARQELQVFMLKAADANAQLTQVEGRGSQIKADLTAIATPLNEQAASTAELLQDAKTLQERVLSDLQAQTSNELARFKVQGNEAIDDIEGQAIARAESVARSQADATARDIANQHWGASCTTSTEDPRKTDSESFARHWYGRSFLIEGDTVWYEHKEGETRFRFAGGEWVEGPTRTYSEQLINQQLSVLDQSTKQTTIQNISAGGGGGGGGERLLASAAARSSGVLIADSSNWRPTGQDPQAGQLLVCITAADGPLAGRKGYSVIDFAYEAYNGGVSFTEHSVLGDLANVYSVSINVTRSAASVPAGVTVSMPSGATATRVFLRIDPQGGTTGGVNNFLIEGLLLWVFTSQGRADAPQNAQSAAWVWQ